MTRSGPHNITEKNNERGPSWREFFLYFLTRGFLSVGDSETRITRMSYHLVERHWLSQSDSVRIVNFCRFLPGPEAFHLAILAGYLNRRLKGGVLAGLLFLLPGALLMIVLSRLYVTYGLRPRVISFLFILKPAVLGILATGAVKLAAGTIRTYLLVTILVASIVALNLLQSNLLLVLVAAGSLNMLFLLGWPRFTRKVIQLRLSVIPALLLSFSLIHPHWLRMGWLFIKTGLFSLCGPYASLVFLHEGAVEEYRWVSVNQLVDGLALSVALPGSLVLLPTFVGYLGGGPIGAVLGTFLVFLPSFVVVLVSARYLESEHNIIAIEAFIAGASAAIVGAIIFITVELAPEALKGTVTVGIAISVFLATTLLKVNPAFVAAVAIAGGIVYAFFNAGI